MTPERIAQIRSKPHGPGVYALLDEICALQAENASLRNRCGDNLCHLSDSDIEALKADPTRIPPWPEFSQSCQRFHSQISQVVGELQGCMTIAQLEAEVERLRINLDVAETIAGSFAYPGKSPFCEHSVRCAVTDDGGKNIRCLLCVEREQAKRIAQLEAEVAEFKKWIIAIDNNCKAARIWTEQCVLQTARIEAGNV